MLFQEQDHAVFLWPQTLPDVVNEHWLVRKNPDGEKALTDDGGGPASSVSF